MELQWTVAIPITVLLSIVGFLVVRWMNDMRHKNIEQDQKMRRIESNYIAKFDGLRGQIDSQNKYIESKFAEMDSNRNKEYLQIMIAIEKINSRMDLIALTMNKTLAKES